jgi:homoserine O-acetyltransferase
MKLFYATAALAFALTSFSAAAADYPAPKQGDWVARDFKFHTGEVMPELRVHEDTRGHGTTGMAKFYKQQLQELLQTAPSVR